MKIRAIGVAFILSLLVTTVAQAGYVYTYTGNTIVSHYTWLSPEDPPPYNVTQEDYDTQVAVSFFSSLLLTGPTLNLPFTISLLGNGYPDDVVIPFPNPFNDPNEPVGSPANPLYEGAFSIAAVGSDGLPTVWDIWAGYSYSTTRGVVRNIHTTTFQDAADGENEGTWWFKAELNNNPGIWSVRSVVLEPKTYAMMLAGLGLMGFVARRCKGS